MTYLTPCLYFMALMSWYMAALMKDHDLPDSLLVFHGFDVVVHGGADDGFHGSDHAVLLRRVLHHQGVRHVGVEHDGVGRDQQHSVNHTLKKIGHHR